VIAPHLDFCFRDAINRRLYRRIRFCKRHRFQSPSTFVETRFIASPMIHCVSPDSSCHPTPNTTNTNHHKSPTNLSLILRLPRCDSPTTPPLGCRAVVWLLSLWPLRFLEGSKYHGSRISLFSRIANAGILASQIANSGEREKVICRKKVARRGWVAHSRARPACQLFCPCPSCTWRNKG